MHLLRLNSVLSGRRIPLAVPCPDSAEASEAISPQPPTTADQSSLKSPAPVFCITSSTLRQVLLLEQT